MKRFAPLGVLLALLLVLAACGETPTPQPPTAPPPTITPVPATDTPVAPKETPTSEAPNPEDVTNIVETVAAMDGFSALSQAIVEADLVEKLSSAGPYTLFAPTDAAFATLDPDITGDPDLLFDLLLYHVVDELITAEDAAAIEMATSLLGDELQFSTEGDNLLVNGVVVVEADIETTNGVIHVIETALIPPTLGSE